MGLPQRCEGVLDPSDRASLAQHRARRLHGRVERDPQLGAELRLPVQDDPGVRGEHQVEACLGIARGVVGQQRALIDLRVRGDHQRGLVREVAVRGGARDVRLRGRLPFRRRQRMGGEQVVEFEKRAHDVAWADAMSHAGENIGDGPSHTLFVEFK